MTFLYALFYLKCTLGFLWKTENDDGAIDFAVDVSDLFWAEHDTAKIQPLIPKPYHCWDTNLDSICDGDEDCTGDGICTIQDCCLGLNSTSVNFRRCGCDRYALRNDFTEDIMTFTGTL